ncbi:hypothetical protein J6590_016920 [Homalodisca vitripennis]|nr:hypothetical protein J6590_016920 [Homalodisca vitripennis]
MLSLIPSPGWCNAHNISDNIYGGWTKPLHLSRLDARLEPPAGTTTSSLRHWWLGSFEDYMCRVNRGRRYNRSVRRDGRMVASRPQAVAVAVTVTTTLGTF